MSARYRFAREAPGWAFPRSALIYDQGKPWRPLSWSIVTPGLAWERRDGKDVIVAEDGSVLPGLIVIELQGSGLLEPNSQVLSNARWFIAHEAAHFWLGQTVRYENRSDAWITEGGADLLAIRTVAATDSAYDPLPELQKEVDDCVKLSDGRGIASAQERGEHRAYYACGAVFALAAEAVSRKGFADWLRPLIDANRADGILSRAEWLAAVGDARVRDAIAELVDRGSRTPGAAITRLFAISGVPHAPAADGSPRLK